MSAPAAGFRFVVFADTHINASETKTASPWAVNRLANRRARAAVAAIDAARPAFAIHLGDVIHPLPGHTGYEEAAGRAKRILAALDLPLKVTPGNHDIGDKPLSWSPAEIVTEDFVAAFEADFGGDCGSFEHEGCAFIGLNAQILNSGMAREARQWLWFEETLAAAKGRRIFVYLHYPPFICHADEHEHYDNLGEPGRSRLLDLLERHGVEACFSGHVHNFFYNRHGGTRLYTLPAISAVRHDFSNLFAVPPGDDSFGRNDGAKLGYLSVEVTPEGHSVRFVRSQGAAQDESGAPVAEEESGRLDLAFRRPHGGSRPAPSGFGATLRGSWAHVVEVPPSGAVDEFRRKPARDDYFIAALWEAGVDRLRIPLDDLEDEGRRARVALLAADGYRFQVYAHGAPDARARALLAAAAGSVAAFELILPPAELASPAEEIRALARDLSLELVLSPLVQSGEDAAEAAFIHFIAHGFPPDREPPAALAAGPAAGIGFRVRHDQDPVASAGAAARRAAALGKRAHLHVATGAPNPAEMDRDETRAANRILLAYIAARCVAPACTVWLDTLTDVDRGYFPRLGMIDRRSTPRLGALSVDRLAEAMAGSGGWRVESRSGEAAGERLALAADDGRRIRIFLPRSGVEGAPAVEAG